MLNITEARLVMTTAEGCEVGLMFRLEEGTSLDKIQRVLTDLYRSAMVAVEYGRVENGKLIEPEDPT